MRLFMCFLTLHSGYEFYYNTKYLFRLEPIILYNNFMQLLVPILGSFYCMLCMLFYQPIGIFMCS